MKKFLSIFIILFVSSFVFAEQVFESVRIYDMAFTKAGSGEAVANAIRPYLKKGYVEVISYDAEQKCLLVMYDTSKAVPQEVESVRFYNFHFTKSGSGQGVIDTIKENKRRRTVSCFTYDSKQECVIIVYEK